MNLAKDKPAFQEAGPTKPSLGVDNDLTTIVIVNKQSKSRWGVDLGALYAVHKVVVFNRRDTSGKYYRPTFFCSMANMFVSML